MVSVRINTGQKWFKDDVRVQVGSVNVAEGGVSQLLLMIEGIRLEANIFLNFGGQMGIREKRATVLCCLLSASHRHSNVWWLTIMANVVACCGVVTGGISAEPLDLSAEDNAVVRHKALVTVSAIHCIEWTCVWIDWGTAVKLVHLYVERPEIDNPERWGNKIRELQVGSR